MKKYKSVYRSVLGMVWDLSDNLGFKLLVTWTIFKKRFTSKIIDIWKRIKK